MPGLETFLCALDVIEYFEDFVELGDHKDVIQGGLDIAQSKPALGFLDTLVDSDQGGSGQVCSTAIRIYERDAIPLKRLTINAFGLKPSKSGALSS